MLLVDEKRLNFEKFDKYISKKTIKKFNDTFLRDKTNTTVTIVSNFKISYSKIGKIYGE